MSTGASIIVVVAAAVLVIALAAALVVGIARVREGGRNRALRRHFGPEYDLTVARHAGDAQAAERELDERLRRHGHLKTQPLSGELRERYVAEWAGVQEEFIEQPARAAADADQLLARLAHDRGFPSDRYDEQVAALSVHHADSVQGYRQLHAATLRAREGRSDTEELREAVVHARVLFEDLVKPPPHNGDGHGVAQKHHHRGGGTRNWFGTRPAHTHMRWAMRGGHAGRGDV
ncbi:hypothetical protein [Streptomyces sp. ME19-01-6]|uniref:hypothetical protein n=1 Tax=Streptomyces sp. ME19-01-6 TaxID=3028686 RepID=UPI0029BEA598|nr:hypothetical protein [Streptomyces sp. ME19-01-6]MDX3224779.1 hypothetical protein [Streptomyces sp. ME19-01-6]